MPLPPLLKTKSEFQWMVEHTQAMEEVEKYITSFPIRMHFDQKLPSILETDAARRKVLGYCLMQQHEDGLKLVEAGSRWLTPAEQNYGMTSLELMGVHWAMEKCKPHLLGLPYFEVVTDHQPLVSILNKIKKTKGLLRHPTLI